MISSTLVALEGDPVTSVEDYRSRGGGAAFRAAVGMGPWVTIEEITLSGLRGRGGGGFRTGRKWSAVRDAGRPGERCFVVANGADGEPGTFKDRAILRHNPYQVIEGLAIAAHAIGAERGDLALKSTFAAEIDRVGRALGEMRAAGLVGEVPVTVVLGPDAYLSARRRRCWRWLRARNPCRVATHRMCAACSPRAADGLVAAKQQDLMVEQTKQRFELACRRCGQHWTWEYEIRRVAWGDDEIVVWRRGGIVASPLAAGVRCPFCGGVRVKAIGMPSQHLWEMATAAELGS